MMDDPLDSRTLHEAKHAAQNEATRVDNTLAWLLGGVFALILVVGVYYFASTSDTARNDASPPATTGQSAPR